MNLADRLLFQHWRAIDADRAVGSASRLSPERRAVLTVVTSAVVLTFLQFTVLRGGLQPAISEQLPGLVAPLWPAAGALLDRYRPLLRNAAWALGCAFYYFVLPALVVKLLFRERLRDVGLSPRGYLRHLWVYAVLFLPVAALVALVSFTPAFQQSYPFYRGARAWSDFLVWEALYGLQFCALEFFFRGFMLHGLRPRYGAGAILFMVVPYCMIHFQKPFLETLGAIVAGFVLGILSLRTRSIWGGATIHIAVATSMDVAALVQRGALPGAGP